MGLVIFGALALYVIVLIAVTWLAYRWAEKRGLARGKRWLAAAGGFLAVYQGYLYQLGQRTRTSSRRGLYIEFAKRDTGASGC